MMILASGFSKDIEVTPKATPNSTSDQLSVCHDSQALHVARIKKLAKKARRQDRLDVFFALTYANDLTRLICA